MCHLRPALNVHTAQTHGATSGAASGSARPSKTFWNQKRSQGMADMLKLASAQHVTTQVVSCLASPEATFWQHSRAGITSLYRPQLAWSIYFFFPLPMVSITKARTFIQNQAAYNTCTILSYLPTFLASDFRDIV